MSASVLRSATTFGLSKTVGVNVAAGSDVGGCTPPKIETGEVSSCSRCVTVRPFGCGCRCARLGGGGSWLLTGQPCLTGDGHGAQGRVRPQLVKDVVHVRANGVRRHAQTLGDGRAD